MELEGKIVSLTKLIKWFSISKSSFYYHSKARPKKTLDKAIVEQIRKIIEEHPMFGVRRITAVLRKRMLRAINRKAVHRVIKANNWQVCKKSAGNRPRVKAYRSATATPNMRWAIDVTSVMCGRDGWCHLTAIIDCCDREIIGWRLSRRGVAIVSAAALEDALRQRGIQNAGLCLRSDNGLVFGSKVFAKIVRQFGLSQEYITPYCPEQNGMIERFFRSIKEECLWCHQFKSKDEAFMAIANWMDWYNKERPHSALGYLSPLEFKEGLKAA